jgi:hypothetical protein
MPTTKLFLTGVVAVMIYAVGFALVRVALELTR